MDFLDKAYGCLLGGLIGDAMGTPTENMEPGEIKDQFGWVDDFEGDGTDDSILKYLLCEALVETGGYATSDDWAAAWIRNQDEITGPKKNRFFVTVQHTFKKLLTGYLPRMASIGNLPSSSSAMSISPIGIVNAGNPRAASAQAQELGSLIHTGDVSFCQDGAAAIAAAVASAFEEKATVDTIMEAATKYLKPASGALLRGLIEEAVEMAGKTGDYNEFRAAYHQRYRKSIACDTRETIPAVFALFLLAEGDPATAIAYGANFGRDTDTIATMAGAVCGALKGTGGFPASWIEKAVAVSSRDQRELAVSLTRVACSKAAGETEAWALLNKVNIEGSGG